MHELTIRLTQEQKQKVGKVALFTNLPYTRIVRQALDLYYETKPFKIKNIPIENEGTHKKQIPVLLDDYYYSEIRDIAQEAGVPMAIAGRQILLWYLETAKIMILETKDIVNSKVG